MLVASGDAASVFVPICTLCFSYLFLLAYNCWDVDLLGIKLGHSVVRVTNRLLETARAGDILDGTVTALMSICHRLKSPGKIVSRRHCLDQADLWTRLWGLSNSFTEMGRPTLNRSRTFWGAEPYTVWE